MVVLVRDGLPILLGLSNRCDELIMARTNDVENNIENNYLNMLHYARYSNDRTIDVIEIPLSCRGDVRRWEILDHPSPPQELIPRTRRRDWLWPAALLLSDSFPSAPVASLP